MPYHLNYSCCIRITIPKNFVFPRKFFARRSGTGVSPLRFNQGGKIVELTGECPMQLFWLRLISAKRVIRG